jgi:hypothetical protein
VKGSARRLQEGFGVIRRRWLLAAVLYSTIAFAVAVPVRAEIGMPSVSCGDLRPIVGVEGGTIACTHGPDPAPTGIDTRVSRPLESSEPAFAGEASSNESAVPCYGDGTSGKRVQALYVHPSDRPDRATEVVPLIRTWAADVDAIFAASAAASGGVRRVRFVTRSDCSLDVQTTTVSPQGDDSIDTTIAELAAQGFNRSDRKYLVWMDSTILCGIAGYYLDDTADAANLNNGNTRVPGSVARIDSGCWGLASRGQSVEAHELLHTLGGVQPTAPHATAKGHCFDEYDRMCYDDGSPGYSLELRCAPADEAYFDCGHDDYFNASPADDNYLATHWDTAASEFLEAAAPVPPPADAVIRLAGDDRIATALATSRNAFPDGHNAAAAVLANADSFADALTGVPLAARKGGPVLLTHAAGLDPRVADELQRVLQSAGTVYLLGGANALGDSIGDAVGGLGFTVTRYGGEDRFETARIIAEQGLGSPDVVLEVTGLSFADALAAGAAAAEIGGSVLLTNDDTQSTETARYLATHPTAARYALGGQATRADPTAQRLAGQDRYATAVLVAKEFFKQPSVIGIASGQAFADALSGGSNIAAHSGPMLLATRAAPLPQSLIEYVESASLDHALLYGGTFVLSDQVALSIARLTQ